jgi:hypothetical protein
VLEEGEQHRRHREHPRDALGLHEPAALGGVEPLHEDQAHAGVNAGAHEHEPVDVVEGHEDQEAVVRGGPAGRDELEVVAHERLVAEAHALGQPGGAAGIGQHQQVLPEEADVRRRRGRRRGHEVGEV